MRDVRNADGHRVAILDERAETIVIHLKGCVTTIIRKPEGVYEIINSKDIKQK